MEKKHQDLAVDLGLLALRATFGGLLAGHGAQKLFGSFGGHGIEGTAGWLESMGLRPGKPWAMMAGASEFGSGALMALGLLGPVGPISAYGPMITAWVTAHAGKPIWVTSGGAEVPLLYMSTATALALIGPGRFSLDRVLGINVPAPLIGLTAAGVAAGIAASLIMREQPAEQEGGTGDAQGQGGEEHANQPGGAAHSPATETDISKIGETGDFQEQLAALEVGSDQPSDSGNDNRGMAADSSGEA